LNELIVVQNDEIGPAVDGIAHMAVLKDYRAEIGEFVVMKMPF